MIYCFANKRGLCDVLAEAIRHDCPFFKTDRNVTKGKYYPDNEDFARRRSE